jgi:plasmid stability protein
MHNACMSTSITIRDVPDETRDELAARASRSGRSLQTYLRAQMIELARKPDIESWLARVREHKEAMDATLSRDAIVVHIEADRR